MFHDWALALNRFGAQDLLTQKRTATVISGIARGGSKHQVLQGASEPFWVREQNGGTHTDPAAQAPSLKEKAKVWGVLSFRKGQQRIVGGWTHTQRFAQSGLVWKK